jgi:trehalose 6-phosphate phosphatase
MRNSLKDALNEVLGRVRTRASLCLDFDGTLAAIAPEPSEARLDESVRQALLAILETKRITIGVISGRAVEDLQSRVGVAGIVYAGNHGLEIVGPGLQFVESTALSTMDELLRVSRQLVASLWQIPGIRVEDKQLTVTVHYRLAADFHLPVIHAAVDEAVGPFASRFQLRSGKKSIEILPRTSWNKGKAVLWINRRLGISTRSAIYVGDDATDEDAFEVLTRGVTIKVGIPGDTHAQYFLNDPGEVKELLEGIALGRAA